MAKKEVWDFECPQYIDFERELDKSGKDDVFFESKEKSPNIHSLCSPALEGIAKGLTDSEEDRLLGKMTLALSVIENTPKVKKSASKGKLLFGKDVGCKSIIRRPRTVPAPLGKSRRSQSLDHLNKIISGKTAKVKKPGMRKSSSLNDVRTHKFKYPITPMCLKRTIFKAKKKNFKTTEEMELEQIAILQKQLIQHLRENEISLRRLNLRPRQYGVSKALHKPDNLEEPKGGNTQVEKPNAAEKAPRRNMHTLIQATVKKGPSKLDAVINDEITRSKKTKNSIYSQKTTIPSVPAVNLDRNFRVDDQAAVKGSSLKLDTTVNNEIALSKNTNTIYCKNKKILSETTVDLNKTSTQKTKKQTYNRIADHSGLMFIPSVKKNTSRPFLFENKLKDMKQQFLSTKQKEKFVLNLKENIDKENDRCTRPQSAVKKMQGTQNTKCDTNKFAELSKITGKPIVNKLRGTPLAENMNRN